MFFISVLAVVVICAHLWVGLAAPIPDMGTRGGQAGVPDKQDFRWPGIADGPYHFGVPVDADDEPKEGRALWDIDGNDIQFGVAGDEALQVSPSSQTVVA